MARLTAAAACFAPPANFRPPCQIIPFNAAREKIIAQQMAAQAAPDLPKRIRDAVAAARKSLDKLTNDQVKDLVSELKTARAGVARAIADFDHDAANYSQAARMANLPKLKTQIDELIDDAKTRQSLLIPAQNKAAMVSGIEAGAADLKAQKVGKWAAVKSKQIERVAAKSFQRVDTYAVQFWQTYRLELAGEVCDEIKRQIKSALSQALIAGDPLYTVTQKLGTVITDPEQFRHAGGRIFPSAANRLDLIVNTENNRVHNQGRLAFYDQVGIAKVRWLTAGDDRVRDTHEANNGRVFPVNDVPHQLSEPNCRCVVVGEPDEKADYLGPDDF